MSKKNLKSPHVPYCLMTDKLIHVIYESKREYDKRKKAEDEEVATFDAELFIGGLKLIYYIFAFILLIAGFSGIVAYTGLLANHLAKLIPFNLVLFGLIMGFAGLGMLLLPAIYRRKKIRLSALKDWRFYAKHKWLVLLFIVILIIIEYYLWK